MNQLHKTRVEEFSAVSQGLSTRALEPFSDVLILTSTYSRDARGFHLESFNAKSFYQAIGFLTTFVQDNYSRSARGVLRGIHYQLPPYEQGKLIRVVSGAVFDVVVDLRRSSPNFGKWAGHNLNPDSGEMLWIPPGFGHGFLALEDNTDVSYKTTGFYAPGAEEALAWNDPDIGIQWPAEFTNGSIKLSERDRQAPRLQEIEVFD